MPLAVGGLAALLTRGSMETFEAVAKPPLAPPGWLFPVVWTVLYVLMGTASYLVLTSGRPNGLALLVYGVQLLFNFFWPLFFFNMQAYLFAFVWLVLLWLLILAATILFFRISRAGRLADGSVFAVGGLRRLSEPLNLSAELEKPLCLCRQSGFCLLRKKRANAICNML